MLDKPSNAAALDTTLGHLLSLVLYGLHVALFIWFYRAIWSRKRSIDVFSICSALGFLVSTVSAATCIWVTTEVIGFSEDPEYIGPPIGEPMNVQVIEAQIFQYVYLLSLVVANLVQIQRCYVVCNRSKLCLAPLVFLFSVTVGIGIPRSIIASLGATGHLGRAGGQDIWKPMSVCYLAASILTNVVAAAFVIHRIKTRVSFESGSKALSRYEWLAVILIEGNVVYTSLQTVFWVLSVVIFYGPYDGDVGSLFKYPLIVMGCMYPLIIALWVELGKNVADRYITPSASARAASTTTDFPASRSATVQPQLSRQSGTSFSSLTRASDEMEKGSTFGSIDDANKKHWAA